MKYGNYNTLYIDGVLTSATQGTVTKETSDRIKSAKSGFAFVSLTDPTGNVVRFFPVVFMLDNIGTSATLSGVRSDGIPTGLFFDLIDNTFIMSA